MVRDGEPDFALPCCVQLFSRGHLEDILRIWDAKSAGMDLGCALDVQLLCGAGLEETKHFLASRPDVEALAALEYLEQCEQSGDFDGFSPAERMDWYRQYFGVEAPRAESSPRPEGDEERPDRPDKHRRSSNRVTAQLGQPNGVWGRRLLGWLLLLSAFLVPSWLVVHLVAWTFGARPAPWDVTAPSWGRAVGAIVLGLLITFGAVFILLRHIWRSSLAAWVRNQAQKGAQMGSFSFLVLHGWFGIEEQLEVSGVLPSQRVIAF